MRDSQPKPEIRYSNETFAPEDELLEEIRAHIQRFEKDGIQIQPYEGAILSFLCQTIQARKVVEFGMLLGYSTVWLARALGEGGRVYTLEKNEEYIAVAEKLFAEHGLASTVQILAGEAQNSMSTLESKGPFDLIFIDADKAGYLDYLKFAEKNLRKGGLVVGDNTFLFGHVLKEPKPENVSQSQWATMREFNRYLAESDHFAAAMLPTPEGMTVAVKL